MSWKTKGMNRDLSVSAFNPEFSFENMNIRLSTNEGNTMMSWVNERGTTQFILKDTENKDLEVTGITIGTAVLNQYLVLFTTKTISDTASDTEPDRIYRLEYNNGIMVGTLLFKGNLKFSTQHPIETLVNYESDVIQKIYWTDKKNQPRLINIADTETDYNDDSFDFVRKLQLEETITVEKVFGISGIFASGVIQYAFTYYTKYGQESSIFYTTPLLYISYKDRGASPEDRVENAFRITINNVDDNFDYIRIYSIQRTSINATPICKRIQDIAISGLDWIDEDNHNLGKRASYTDTGMSGDSIDPTELLYKGGEVIKVETLESKDNTLFFGNIEIDRKSISDYKSELKRSGITLEDSTRSFLPMKAGNSEYDYSNQLTSINTEDRLPLKTIPCSGFREFDFYRCGIQFQHETGKWSEPLWLGDHQMSSTAQQDTDGTIIVPTIKAKINYEENKTFFDNISEAGYKRMRPVVVFPELTDRMVVSQGIMAPTVYTVKQRNTDKNLYAQSSWFFRPYIYDETGELNADAGIIPKSQGELNYNYNQVSDNPVYPSDRGGLYNPKFIRRVEIEGDFSDENKFNIDRNRCTFHSPDIEFDEQMSLMDFGSVSCFKIGQALFTKTLSDINIQTETPIIGNAAAGFIHKNFSTSGPNGIVAGLFYDDYVVDDDGTNFEAYRSMVGESTSAKWMVYPWQANGSLNNDINRPASSGIGTALLKKKVISNLRYTISALTQHVATDDPFTRDYHAQLFSSNEVSIVKFQHSTNQGTEEGIYMGNIDTMLTPDYTDGKYFAFEGIAYESDGAQKPSYQWAWNKNPTSFNSNSWFKTFNGVENVFPPTGAVATIRGWNKEYVEHEGIDRWDWDNNLFGGNDIGDNYSDLVLKKSPVRMKYKSTPHLIGEVERGIGEGSNDNEKLQIFDLIKPVDDTTIFGGQSADAFRENTWLPCGEPVSLSDKVNIGTEEEPVEGYNIYFDYGDTYYQRWDCLKTYPFTKEDINQIIEIGSFMLETHINIDGRYDRNRGLQSNLNISPENFNLINTVYSQKDNFFTYKILDDDYYKNKKFHNQITWSKTKTSGADVDMWTNITLASILELDGDKGAINKLIRFNDQLLCLQDSGISQILYNENTQISTTEGVPIEIANSGKVQGKRYLSDTVGCKNKWSVVSGGTGIFFIDSNERSIYMYNGQLNNLSISLGFNSWCKNNITNEVWNPWSFTGFASHYDKKNKEVLFTNKDISLAYSEKHGTFTSFYDYGGAPWFCNFEDKGIWITNDNTNLRSLLWGHQSGEYCNFFGDEDNPNYRPYGMILVGNPEPQMDKTFTNLEFRASVDGDGTPSENLNSDGNPKKVTPYLPFDSLETWNEYQHGYTELDNKSGHVQFIHGGDSSALIRKFRIWRCDIPRNNCLLDVFNTDNPNYRKDGEEYPYCMDAELDISRHIRKPLDRMRNPWLYLKLQKSEDTNRRVEIHDIVMTYFI